MLQEESALQGKGSTVFVSGNLALGLGIWVPSGVNGQRAAAMDTLLKDGSQGLQAITARAFGGDSHFFEDLATPEKIREQLDSNKATTPFHRPVPRP